MPWYTNLVAKPIEDDMVKRKLIPNHKYRVIKVDGHVDIHSKQDHRYIMTVTPELARDIFQPPYWENE
jgi:hypothetical protein